MHGRKNIKLTTLIPINLIILITFGEEELAFGIKTCNLRSNSSEHRNVNC